MKNEIMRAIGLMLMIDGAVLALLLLAIVTRIELMGIGFQQMTPLEGVAGGVGVGLASGPVLVLLSKLIDKAEGEVL